MLTDCLEQCQANETCSSVNYETGLCVLFSSNADKLPGKAFILIEFFYSNNNNVEKKVLSFPFIEC
jgi:hypothetical protein